jgi:hypothetical protein
VPVRSLVGDFALFATAHWLDLAAIQSRFDAVPLDPYVADGYRFKSIARISVNSHVVKANAHEPLFQSKQYNPTHGDIVREYPQIAPDLLAALTDVIRLFATAARLTSTDEILVQAQRIKTGDATVGLPAVEGFHQDDVDLVGLLVVSRHEISCGHSFLSRTRGTEQTVFAGELAPGDLLVFNDRALFHYTSPIHPLDAGSVGHRDVVLLAWPSSRRACSASSL